MVVELLAVVFASEVEAESQEIKVWYSQGEYGQQKVICNNHC